MNYCKSTQTNLRRFLPLCNGKSALCCIVGYCCCVFALLCYSFAPSALVAQTTSTKPSEKSDKTDKNKEQPLELPEFVITGVEAIDVPGGTKQRPAPTPRLSAEELNRLNPLEKQTLKMLPPPRLPELALAKQAFQGFVRGEFGMFLTPSLEAGYHAVWNDFDLYARVASVGSAGHLPNADFLNVSAEVQSSYIAADKFFFFGGSKTDSHLRFRAQQYQFFGEDITSGNSLYRAVTSVGGGLQTHGTFESLAYSMGASFDHLGLGLQWFDGVSIATQSLARGNLLLKTPLDATKQLWLGGRTAIDLQVLSLPSATLYFWETTAQAEYSTPQASSSSDAASLRVTAELGVQVLRSQPRPEEATNSTEFLANINAELRASPLLTVRGGFRTGSVPNSYHTMLHDNPYLHERAFVQYSRSLYDIRLQAFIHPSSALTFALGGRLHSVERYRAFSTARDIALRGIGFGVLYMNAVLTSVDAELLWLLSRTDRLSINAVYTDATPGTPRQGVRQPDVVPYIAPLHCALDYERWWTDSFSTTLGVLYVGERWGSAFEGVVLPSFVNLRLGAHYGFSERLSAFVRSENLLNQRIVLWQGYQERGVFVSVGATFKF